ncbi:hypothetical protein M758_3G102600 [Ceratodon purpureus]|nr:hypothetical protein M758_3G102600 [Ceratodon purpureus]
MAMMVVMPQALLLRRQLCPSSSRLCCTFSPGLVRRLGVRCCSGDESSDKQKLVFLGTPEVAAGVLDALLDASQADDSLFRIAAIVTQPPAARGRGRKQLPSPVAARALERDFSSSLIWSPEKASEEGFLADLRALNPDVCITAAYGNFLPSKFLAIPTYGTVNVHPSLLPLYRGAAPVQRALYDGVDVSGVTVAYTVRSMDAGPVIASERVDIDPNIKAPELLTDLFKRGTKLLLRELPGILDGSAKLKATPQDDSLATHAPKVTVEESWLSFQEETAAAAHNKVRAFAEWPGAKGKFDIGNPDAEMKTLDLKIITTRVGKKAAGDSDGVVKLVGDALVVPCGDKTTLEILELQPPGKKVMRAKDFCNGLRGQQILVSYSKQISV